MVPGADSLEFRDVEGVSAEVAYLLAAGPGDRSRIYKTEDAGRTWSLQFTNRDTSAFYDCFAFWDARRGFTMSDAVAGRFPVVRTTDGATWSDIGGSLPEAQSGEGAFAASGTCTAVIGERHGWIATGAAARARVLATTDGGETWREAATPIVQGSPTSGGSSIEFRDTLHGILAGGNIAAPDSFADNVARSARRGPQLAARQADAVPRWGVRSRLRGCGEPDGGRDGSVRRRLVPGRGRPLDVARRCEGLLGGGLRRPARGLAGGHRGPDSQAHVLARHSLRTSAPRPG